MHINENGGVSYRVVCDGNVLLDSVTKFVAEQFVATLNTNTKEKVEIQPVTEDGLQVLLG